MVWRVQCLVLITVMAVSTVSPLYYKAYPNRNPTSTDRIVFDTKEVLSKNMDNDTGRKVTIQTTDAFNSLGLQINKDADAVPTLPTRSFAPQVTDDCLQLGYCKHLPNYPIKHVKNILNKFSEVATWLQMNTISEDQIALLKIPPTQKMEICASKQEMVAILAAPDQNNVWHTIINDPKKPIQRILTEVCVLPKNASSVSCSSVVPIDNYRNYYTSCETKGVYRNVAALDIETGNPIMIPVQVPGCCSCLLIEKH